MPLEASYMGIGMLSAVGRANLPVMMEGDRVSLTAHMTPERGHGRQECRPSQLAIRFFIILFKLFCNQSEANAGVRKKGFQYPTD